MKTWYWRMRYLSLWLTGAGLLAISGCGLSDRQWATIWQSVMQTGLNAVVTNVVGAAFNSGTGT